MGLPLSRSVEIQVQNKTQSITLRNPRTYFECGSCSKIPSDVAPGSSVSGTFPGSFPFWGVAGILVFKADSFTLAVYFSNPVNYSRFRMELGLELSQGRAHDDLESTYNRMAQGNYSDSFGDIKFHRDAAGKEHGTARLSHGPLRVTATMSSETSSILKMVLEEEGGWSKQGELWPGKAKPGETRTRPGEVTRGAPRGWEKPGDTPKTWEICQGPQKPF